MNMSENYVVNILRTVHNMYYNKLVSPTCKQHYDSQNQFSIPNRHHCDSVSQLITVCKT